MRKLLPLLVSLLAPVLAFAAEPYDFIVDELYYKIHDQAGHTVYVCNPNTSDTRYKADTIVVPATVTHQGTEWTVTGVAPRTFYSINVKSLTLPNTVKVIESNALSLCRYLTHLDLGTGIERLEEQAISSLAGLTGFKLPPNVKFIGKQAVGLTMTTVNIPASVDSLDPTAFYNCSNLASYTVDENNPKYKAVNGDILSKDGKIFLMHPRYSTATTISLPESVVAIGHHAFWSCLSLTTPLVIPARVTSIGEWGFAQCRNIPSVETGGLRNIAPFSFAWISKAEKLTINSSVERIEANAFESFGGSAYKTIDSTLFIPANIKFIGRSAFTGSAFPKLEIAEGIEFVDTMAFSGMGYLQYIKLPSTLKRINMLGFQTPTKLKAINLPASLTYIGDGAFIGSNKVPEVTIGANVSYIGRRAFAQCTSLKAINVVDANPYFASKDGVLFSKDFKVLKTYPSGLTETSYTVPTSVTEIEGGCFASCSRLQSVILHENISKLGVGVWQQCSGLKTIELPDAITDLPEGSFMNCSSLDSIKLPRHLRTIGYQAFFYSNRLSKITLPRTLEYIGDQAFFCIPYPTSMSSNLLTVTANMKKPCYIGQDAFAAKTYTNGTLYVPENCKTAYSAADGWKNFKNINEDARLDVNGIDADGNMITVTSGAGSITVTAPEALTVNVYTTAGTIIYSGTATEISNLSKGIYIVTVGDKVFKVAI